MTEAQEQAVLFAWAAYFPELRWMYAVPNGGYRNPKEAAHLKAQGVKAGVADICLPLPRGKYHGLYIELKVGKNKPTEKQVEFLTAVSHAGYAAVVCYGAADAIDVISQYLRS